MPSALRPTPQALAEHAECMAVLPEGHEERCTGYGVMGLRFASGHLLAFRRWPASSLGPGYTSVLHRLPDESWRVYTDCAPMTSCARYLAVGVDQTIEAPIRMSWTGPHTLLIEVQDVGLSWEVSLHSNRVTRIFNALRGLVPNGVATSPAGLRLIERSARRFLHVGRVMLRGALPDGKSFRAVPRRLWHIQASKATWAGADLGVIDRTPVDARIGPTTISTSGLFAFATARLESKTAG